MKIFKLLILFSFFFLLFTFSPAKADAAVKTWNPAGCGSTSWNTAGNWSGGLPGTGDIATFDGATSNCNVTVDTSVDVAGINITGSYTGTITQGNGNDINLRGSGYVQNASGSTFTGGNASSDITMSVTSADFTLTSGTFNAPGGTLNVADDFSNSGTFTPGSGTVLMMLDGGGTSITGSTTFNVLSFDSGCGQSEDITVSGTMTVNTTFNVGGDTCFGNPLITGGTIDVKGDINVNNANGYTGDTTITLTGSSSHTVTGGDGSDHREGIIPSLTINTTGTVNFVDNIRVTSDWTYTQGTLNMGTSTIDLAPSDTITAMTVNGNTTFYNLSFSDGCTNGSSVTFNSGATLTVNGTLTFQHSCNQRYDMDGSGEIRAYGNITITEGGVIGNIPVKIIGTANQTVTGDTGVDANTASAIPSITIDKPSGTLTFVNYIRVTDDFINIRGNIDPGTSTIAISPYADQVGSITGSTTFYNLEFGNPCINNYTQTISSGTLLTVKNNLITDNTCGYNGVVNGPGAINVEGDISITDDGAFGDVAVTLTGSKDQTYTNTGSDQSFYTGTFTINKTAGTVILGSNLSLDGTGQDLVIANGILNYNSYVLGVIDTTTINGQMNGSTGTFVNVGPVVVGTKGVWSQSPSGTIFLASTVTNSGFIRFQGGGSTCGGSNNITLSASGGSSSWSGGGTFILNDLTIQDMQGGLTAYSSTNNGNTNWTFNAGCPTYSNRSTVSVGSGTSFSGGTQFISN